MGPQLFGKKEMSSENKENETILLSPEKVRELVDKRVPNEVIGKIMKGGGVPNKIREINEAVKDIAKYSGETGPELFATFGNDKAAEGFVNNPKTFVDIAKKVGAATREVFGMLYYSNKEFTETFTNNPQKIIAAFKELAEYRGIVMPEIFFALHDDDIAKIFRGYINKEVGIENLMVNILSTSENGAVELGRPLDDLHDQSAKRNKYLEQLSTAQVVGLLCSNPEFFYTSSNHLLFDRLKEDMKGNGLDYLISKYGLNETQLQNLIFRAINYDRLLGRSDSIFEIRDVSKISDTMARGLENNEFDAKYFYMLANSIGKNRIGLARFKDILHRRIDKLENSHRTLEEEKIYHAIRYLKFLAGETDSKNIETQLQKNILNRGIYDIRYYRGIDGKAQVLQIFEKRDTKKDHWPLTQQWFERKYGKPRKGESGELIYETKDARIVLYMGEKEEDNQRFVKNMLDKNQNMIITFRGHSYSLKTSFPSEIFGNNPGNILFIPGSCGSAGSVPEYLTKNPKTDLRFFSNTSTGRGQVTNAIVDLLLEQKKPREFSQLLKENSHKIVNAGGDRKTIETIKMFNAGEALLYYVNSKINE